MGKPRHHLLDPRAGSHRDEFLDWQWLSAEDNSDQMSRLYRNLRQVRETELTECQAEMIRLYYDEGMSIPQIAREKGVHKSTVSRTLARGREKIKRYLQYSW